MRRAGRKAMRPKDARLAAFERMQVALDAYRANHHRKATALRAYRALVRLCRLHGMTLAHARLLAELGRVDDDAGAKWRLSLDGRSSSAIREREARERKRDADAATFVRQSRRFAAVLGRIEQKDTLEEACVAVGEGEEPPVGERAVARDYRAIAKAYRDGGIFTVPYKTADRLVKLPLPGRPREKV